MQQAIPENQEEDQGLRVIRPEKGIDKSQFQPIIRLNKNLNIALSPLRLSPNNHRLVKKQGKEAVERKEVGVSVNLANQSSTQAKQRQSSDESKRILVQASNQLPTVNKRSIEFLNNASTSIDE